MNWGNRRAWAVAAAVALGWLVALTAPRDFSVGNFVDDAHYAVLAKALREQGAYRTINLPDAPRETKYPPGFPSLLALVWSPDRTDPANLDALRWVNLSLVGALAAALAVLAMELFGISPPVAVAVAMIGLLHPGTAALWMVPLSEPLALLLLCTGLALIGSRRGTLGTVVLVMATYVRTLAGSFLVAALVLRWWQGDRGVKRDVVLAVLAFLPWAVWQLVNRGAVPEVLLGLYGSYGEWYLHALRTDWFTVIARVPLSNLLVILQEVGARLVGRALLPSLLVAASGVVVAWRLWVSRRDAPIVALGVALFFAVVLLWPFPPDRLVAGIWPLMLVVVAGSLRRYAVGAVLVALAVAGPGYARGNAVFAHEGRGALSDALIAKVRPYIPPDAVLATTNPGLHYLSLGVHTVPGHRMRSYRAYRLGHWSTAWGLGDDLWDIVRRYQPGFVLVERRGFEGRSASGSLQGQCPAVLTLVWESPLREFLYRVNPGVACSPVATQK